MSFVKYSITSGLPSSAAPLTITSPSIVYRSGFLSGLCSPERGQPAMRSTYGPISAIDVSGTFTNPSPLSGSMTVPCFAALLHTPPTRFLPTAGVAALMAHGSTVAHDGT